MKVYTGTGDKGKTSLFSGERRLKSDLRIDAYGEVDELNSFVGGIKAAWQVDAPEIDDEIDRIQGWLLDAGAWLATTPGSSSADLLKPFTMAPATHLETAIDRISEELPELRQFILPQGHLSAALAHMARTVCRRTERRVITLAEAEGSLEKETLGNVLVFLNRLSDYLFVLARYMNKVHGVQDPLWGGQ